VPGLSPRRLKLKNTALHVAREGGREGGRVLPSPCENTPVDKTLLHNANILGMIPSQTKQLLSPPGMKDDSLTADITSALLLQLPPNNLLISVSFPGRATVTDTHSRPEQSRAAVEGTTADSVVLKPRSK
jgi:hypothetical protein